MTTNTVEFLTLAEVAKELNLSIRAVQHRVKAGSIAATKIGPGRTSAYVVSKAEVERVKAADSAAPAAS